MSRVRAKPASLPVRRLSPTAAAVPTTVARSAASAATSSELPSDPSHTGLVKKFWYQRSENSVGGNWNDWSALKLSGITTRVGRMK